VATANGCASACRQAYEWIGLALLRSHWINFDLVWIAALSLGGALLLLG
jgi:hypothetical protein